MASPNSKASIGIVIVSWNVAETLRDCLVSIFEAQKSYDGEISIAVVDNDSSDDTVAVVEKEFPEVILIANKENRGFGAACNQGAKAIVAVDYLFFLNPDTTINKDTLNELASFLDEQPNVGLLGPKLINEDGSVQPSARRYPTVASAMLLMLKLHRAFPNSLPLRWYFMYGFKHETLREVDQVMGAAMLVRRKLFQEINGFDERFFIWFEEVDLCRRIREQGMLVMFVPWAEVLHQKSRSFAQRSTLWRQWHFSKSCRQYFWKHHGIIGASLVSTAAYLSLFLALLSEVALRLGARFTQSVDENK